MRGNTWTICAIQMPDLLDNYHNIWYSGTNTTAVLTIFNQNNSPRGNDFAIDEIELIGLYAEFSPVDQTADGIVKIAEYAQKQTVFHLNNPYPLYFDRMIDIFKSLNIKI